MHAELGHTDVVFIEPGSLSMEVSTRDRVLKAVSEHGPISAASLAAALELTPAAIRRHLDALAAEGTIEEREPAVAGHAPRRRGRPARSYVLSVGGHRSMQATYDGIATAALRLVARTAGEDAVGAFARERIDELEQRFRVALDSAGDNTVARTEALASALNTEGYAASVRPMGEDSPLAGVQLCQGHCPIQQVATEFPQFCEAEADAFSRLLGVPVQRLATLARGQHVCTTFVPTPVVPRRSTTTPHTSDDSPTPHTSDERSSR